jgi:DNA relaxase NicK
MEMTTRVHWLTFTVFGLNEQAFSCFWDDNFANKLGRLTLVPGGIRRGFGEMYQGLCGSKLYRKPVQKSERGDYFSVELPGDACDCLTPTDYQNLYQYQQQGIGFGDCELRVSRIDVAVDNCNFTPRMVYEHVRSGMVKTRAKRSSIVWYESPEALRDDGQLGCDTFTIGAGESERKLRIYNKRGFTRVELQSRDNWANVTFDRLFSKQYGEWMPIVTGLIDLFFSITSSFWEDFLTFKQQMTIVIGLARQKTVEKMTSWIVDQVAPTIQVLRSIMGMQEFDKLVEDAVTIERLKRFLPVLQLS